MTDAKLIDVMKSCGTGKEACDRCPFGNPDDPHWHPECLYRAVSAAADRLEALVKALRDTENDKRNLWMDFCKEQVRADKEAQKNAAYKADIEAGARDCEAEVERLRAKLAVREARWEETASDNTEYTLAHFDGIYTVCNPRGMVVCEFIRDAALDKCERDIDCWIREEQEDCDAGNE